MFDQKMFLIDAHALCYRSFYAIKSLSTSYGQMTNAVYGFISILKKILRQYEPTHMAICFDAGKKTLRQEKFAEYKIHRAAMPDDLIPQIQIIKEVIQAYRLPKFELEGFEADDLIATLAKQGERTGVEVIIVSDDKDMAQLISKRIKVFNTRKEIILGPHEAREFFGIDPQKIPDFIGLAGDQTDNIPGVLGIGELTAKKLLNEFGSLENVFDHIDEIKSAKIKSQLLEQKDMAFFCKELAVLDDHVPISVDLDQLKVVAPDNAQLFEMFKKFEFKKFAEEIAGEVTPKTIYTMIPLDDQKTVDQFIRKVEQAEGFSLILNASDPLDLASCTGILLNIGHTGQEVYFLDRSKIDLIKPVLEKKNILKLTYDVKQVLKILAGHNCSMRGHIFDAMLAAYLLVPSQGNYTLETLAWTYFKQSIGVDQEKASLVSLLDQLYPVLMNALKEKSLLKLFTEIEIPLAYVLAKMERAGVNLDLDLLSQLSIATEKKIQALVGEIYQLAGGNFNLNSPKQLSTVLFEQLKLPVVKKTKTGFSTDESVLSKLAEKHRIAALILEFRQLAKLKSTYIDALPKLINPSTQRVHAYFDQTGTETGRLSSLNPNLQNIPIRTELGRQIRRAFIPSQKDHMIVSADYSQIELRILAHFSADPKLTQAFLDDQDVHAHTAALIFDTAEDKVTSDMRNVAKRINFGIIYGMSAFGLAKDLGISQTEAQIFIDRYFLRYPKVKTFMETTIQKAHEQGFVGTILNRRRYLPEINSKDQTVRQFAERQAINTPVQGSAADLMKLAMINIQQEIEKRSLLSQMIITVHDELVFDVPITEEAEIIEVIREKMEGALDLSVPIKVSIKKGKNWLDMTKLPSSPATQSHNHKVSIRGKENKR